jgi:prevent-host-death family protein
MTILLGMIEAAIHEAKTKLTALLKRVEEGEHVVITRHGKPIAEIVPYKRKGGIDLDAIPRLRKELGMSEGGIDVPADFDDPMPEDFLNLDDPDDPLRRL